MPLATSRLARLAAAAAAAAAFTFAAFASIAPATAGDVEMRVRLFGASERANPDLSPFPKWTSALARYQQERALEARPCQGGNCALRNWVQFLAGLKGQSPLRQLEAVNEYVNRTPYQEDASRYGMNDYWATPRDFFGRSGDCEDYAFAKYLSLRKLGWSADQLRVVVLMHHQRREIHAVLVAYHDGTAYVLDNLMGRVVEHAALPHYQPYFSINEHAWFHHSNWSPNARIASAVTRPVTPPANPGGAGNIIGTRRPMRVHAAPAARSYAGNASESTASLFTPNGTH
jgi:predicted transglutaminase-like cysteine proteinase